MDKFDPKQHTPPFNQWVFLDMGSYFTFGRILKQTPNEVVAGDDFKSLNGAELEFQDYQFFIQDMTTVTEHPNAEDFAYGYLDNDFPD
jgi:hypothetical protein